MLIYELRGEEVINNYGKRVPSIVDAVTKYEAEKYVVFEEDDIPKAVFALRTHNAMGITVCHLTAIAALMFDMTPKLMKRYRDQHRGKKDVLAYDLPAQVHVAEIQPNILRFAPIQFMEDNGKQIFKGVELDDEDMNIGEREITEIVQQSPGVHFSLSYSSPAKQSSMARFLAECHEYQVVRRVFIL